MLVGIEAIQPVFQDLCFGAVLIDFDIVVLVDVGAFNQRATSLDFDFRIGEAGINHLYRTVVVQTKKRAGDEQDFNFSALSVERLSSLQLYRTYGTGTKLLIANGCQALDVVDAAGLCRV